MFVSPSGPNTIGRRVWNKSSCSWTKRASPGWPEAKAQAVQVFRQKWAERNPTTPNPEKCAALLEKERKGELGAMAAEAAAPRS